MDVGHRKSRQRRHLPTNVTTLQHQGSSSISEKQKQQQHDDNMDMENYRTSRGRKHATKKRMQNFGNMTIVSKSSTQGSWIQWRVWFWRLCVVWLAFLMLRVVTSLWQGDTTRLGLAPWLPH